MNDTVRVLVVDDSPSMRRLIRLGIETDPRISVVAEAGSAREARDAVNLHNPDVMTLDVEMPHMDGLEFLARLMRAHPMPVVMVSSLTADGSETAIRALALGAIDCIAKPRFGEAGSTYGKLAETLLIAAQASVRPRRASRPKQGAAQTWESANWNDGIVLMGSSTGGVEALEVVLSSFPQDCPPTLITQHMPAPFLINFATRLNAASAPVVALAQDGMTLEPGRVLIAPGGDTHMVLKEETGGLRVSLRAGGKVSGHRPSVDALFQSATMLGARAIAVLLTGMGSDGAHGMSDLRKSGAYCIAQDKESCVVYGMPRVAVKLGGVDISLPLDSITSSVLNRASKSGKVRA